MARVALGRHCDELAARCALVAGIAIHRCVRSRQRKAVVMLLHLLNRNLPSANCVALLAIRSELTPVDVGVAILASLPYVAEHRLGMALDASHRLVHAAQRIFRLVVIEFRNGANWFPRARRVTVLTRYVQIAMRTVCSSVRLRVRTP